MTATGEPSAVAGRPMVFVASSSEGRPYAEAVQAHLRAVADVDVWTDDVFRLNRAYLDDLLDGAGFYDYAVAVMTPDDAVVVRDVAGVAARDNVIFEFGLFLGRLGPHRCFALREAGVRTISDLAGIEMASFTAGPDPVAATQEGCRRIRAFIEQAEARYHIGFLPSTALALGYYHNFLGRLLDALLEEKELWVADPEAPAGRRRIAYAGRRIEVTILLPRRLADLEEQALKSRTRKLTKVRLETTFRPFPFYVQSAGALDGDPLALIDIPTTLRASRHAIEQTFGSEFLRDPATYARIERREISNFERTLHHVLKEDGMVQDVTIRFEPLA